MGSLISHLDTFRPEESAGASILVHGHPQEPLQTITNLISSTNDAVINLDMLTVSEIDPSTSSGEDDGQNAEDNASILVLSSRSFAAAFLHSGAILEVVDGQKSGTVSEIFTIADGFFDDDEIVADSVADLTSASDLDSLPDHHHPVMAYSVELGPSFPQANHLDDDNIVVEDSAPYFTKFSSAGDSSDSDMSIFFQNARLPDEEIELALLTKDLQQQVFEKTPSPIKRLPSSLVPESDSEVAVYLQNNPFSPSAMLKRTKKLNKMARKLKRDIRKRRFLSDSSDIIRDEDTIWNSVASQRTRENVAPDGLESER